MWLLRVTKKLSGNGFGTCRALQYSMVHDTSSSSRACGEYEIDLSNPKVHHADDGFVKALDNGLL